MKKQEIKELFVQGIDCSQVVAENFKNEIGMNQEILRRMTACFGGGMMRGETCGCVTAALMLIGLKYGHFKEGDIEQKAIMKAKSDEFKELFLKKYNSTICRELLGYDLSKAEEFQEALESGRLFEFCPTLTEETIKVLQEIL